MARSRNIKPGFFKNEYLAELHPLARLLFIGLWILADREGRLEDRPKKIKAELLPYDDCDVDELLNQLANSPERFIIRYEVNGKRYIAIPNFLKHQNPHVNEPASTIPAPEEYHTSTVQTPEEHSTNPADSLMLIPDSLKHENNTCPNAPDGAGVSDPSDDKNQKPKLPRVSGYTPEFEECWKHYPRKVDKGAAFKAWRARLKDGYSPEDMIAATKNYAAYIEQQRIEKRYIKHAATFFGPSMPFVEWIKGPPESESDPRADPMPPRVELVPEVREFWERRYRELAEHAKQKPPPNPRSPFGGIKLGEVKPP